ncbi:MAG: tripartite tricarboxylate transporter substrate binding protein [Pseudomonadota bacterium]
MRMSIKLLAAALCIFAAAPALAADDYPNRPIRWVSPWPAGGTNDILSRMIARQLETRLGQPIIVDNRAGAAGTIGSDFTAKSAPDGYTITLGSTPTHATARVAYPNLPYNPLTDFEPITRAGTLPNVLVVRPTLEVKSVAELIAHAKANPGKLNFYSSGIGSSQHLSGELFKKMAGLDVQHVPYKGQALGFTDLLAGRIDFAFDNITPLLPYIQNGQVRALAVSTANRSPALPDTPTVAEAGLPGYDAAVWFGVFAPRGVPAAILDKLNAAIVDSLKSPELAKRLSELGVQDVGSTRAEFGAFYRRDIEKWNDLIKSAGIAPN